jgi:hypothetical protein
MKIIKWIKYKTHSSQTNAIKNGIFITQFFNTAFIILFINSDFSDFGPST